MPTFHEVSMKAMRGGRAANLLRTLTILLCLQAGCLSLLSPFLEKARAEGGKIGALGLSVEELPDPGCAVKVVEWGCNDDRGCALGDQNNPHCGDFDQTTMQCVHLSVEGCGPTHEAFVRYTNGEDQPPTTGIVFMHTGGLGDSYYDGFEFAPTIIQVLEDAGLRALRIRWRSRQQDGEEFPQFGAYDKVVPYLFDITAPPVITLLKKIEVKVIDDSARFAALVRWALGEPTLGSPAPLVRCTGNSMGAVQCLHLLAYYDFDLVFDEMVWTGGPVFAGKRHPLLSYPFTDLYVIGADPPSERAALNVLAQVEGRTETFEPWNGAKPIHLGPSQSCPDSEPNCYPQWKKILDSLLKPLPAGPYGSLRVLNPHWQASLACGQEQKVNAPVPRH
jgi:hypothetical protein